MLLPFANILVLFKILFNPFNASVLVGEQLEICVKYM